MEHVKKNTKVVKKSFKRTKRNLNYFRQAVSAIIAIFIGFVVYVAIRFKHIDIYDKIMAFGVILIGISVCTALIVCYRGYSKYTKEDSQGKN